MRANRARGGDDTLKPGQTPLGDDETAGVVRERNYAKEADHQGKWSRADRERRTSDRRGGYSGGKEQSTAPAERTELRRELEAASVMADPHARDEGKANADVVAVRHHDVIQLLELGAQRYECGIERQRRSQC